MGYKRATMITMQIRPFKSRIDKGIITAHAISMGFIQQLNVKN
jgi:hypothetical protein